MSKNFFKQQQQSSHYLVNIIEDVTDKKAADKKDKEDSKKEVKRLKARIEELEIDIDHKKLLKRLAKECLK